LSVYVQVANKKCSFQSTLVHHSNDTTQMRVALC